MPTAAALRLPRSKTNEAPPAPRPEERAALGRSLLSVLVLALAAWAIPIGVIWLVWHALR